MGSQRVRHDQATFTFTNKLLYIKYINNKVLLYIQYLIINYNGKEFEKCIYTWLNHFTVHQKHHTVNQIIIQLKYLYLPLGARLQDTMEPTAEPLNVANLGPSPTRSSIPAQPQLSSVPAELPAMAPEKPGDPHAPHEAPQ